MEQRLRSAIINLFKKHGRKIVIALIIWIIILLINFFVSKIEIEPEIDTNYKPHEPVMGNDEVPESLRSPIEELIGKFVDNCNNKDYEAAYSLLSKDCKENVYPDMDLFKEYVDSIFVSKKMYTLKNFSNKYNRYIYTVNILNDIMASGLNGEEDEDIYSEKYVVFEEDGELKLSIREYVGRDDLTYMYEDDYMKIKIESVDMHYDYVIYNLKITNKSENCIVFADYSEDYEIALETSEGFKRMENEVLEPISIEEGEAKEFKLKYTIFFDENTKINDMLFDYIRVYKNRESYENGEEPIDDFGVRIMF